MRSSDTCAAESGCVLLPWPRRVCFKNGNPVGKYIRLKSSTRRDILREILGHKINVELNASDSRVRRIKRHRIPCSGRMTVEQVVTQNRRRNRKGRVDHNPLTEGKNAQFHTFETVDVCLGLKATFEIK